MILNLSNPALLKHIKGTLLNQDYKLSNVESIEDTQLFDILNEKLRFRSGKKFRVAK